MRECGGWASGGFFGEDRVRQIPDKGLGGIPGGGTQDRMGCGRGDREEGQFWGAGSYNPYDGTDGDFISVGWRAFLR